jgi:hypothetical protein
MPSSTKANSPPCASSSTNSGRSPAGSRNAVAINASITAFAARKPAIGGDRHEQVQHPLDQECVGVFQGASAWKTRG